MKDVSNFSVLLFIFIFIFSLVGMELFAFQVKFDDNAEPIDPANILDADGNDIPGNYPDSTFNTFLEAMISVFIVLANDGWSTIYINHKRATGSTKSNIFFISLLIVGQFILLYLFLAILLGNFEQESLQIRGQMEDAILKKFEHG